MLHLKNPKYIGEKEILQIYNELYTVYQGQQKEIILLGIAYKNALNGEYTQLFDFDNFIEENSRFGKIFFPVRGEVKQKVLNIARFSNKEQILDDIENKTPINSKLILLNRLVLNLSLSRAGNINNPKEIPNLTESIASYLEYDRFLFLGEFPIFITEFVIFELIERGLTMKLGNSINVVRKTLGFMGAKL